MKRVPANNPDESRASQSGPELIQIDEIIGLDNPEVTMPQERSPGDISAQPKIERTSGRESAPNPLHDLIKIYDDDESSEVSLVTLVKITEEKRAREGIFPSSRCSNLGPSIELPRG
jgi:hypothetical protein